MAQLMQLFDATKIDPSQGGGNLPVGRHKVVVTSSEVKATKDNSGGYIAFELSVIDGPNTGSTGTMRFNLYNQNPKAVEIAQRQLSSLCHAVGVYHVQDSQQLHNLPFVVQVELQKDAEAAAKGYTEVRKIFDQNGNEPGKSGATVPAPAPAPVAPATAPVQAAASGPAAPTAAWGAPQPAQQAPQQPAWGAPTAPAEQPPAAGGWQQQAPSGAPAPWGAR